MAPMRLWPYQEWVPKPRSSDELHGRYSAEAPLQGRFPRHLPKQPHCADDYTASNSPHYKRAALKKKYIQFNSKSTLFWLVFDVDKPDACMAPEEHNLPPASVTMINPTNGHAHIAYLLAIPVHRYQDKISPALSFYDAVRRGYTARLGADSSFAGFLVQNPYHPDWHTIWGSGHGYTLAELDGWLCPEDKQFTKRAKQGAGEGRNASLFNDLRRYAYIQLRESQSADQFRANLQARADAMNCTFAPPLERPEVASIVKSVAKWVSRNFSAERFREVQSKRGKLGAKKRWQGHVADSRTLPWIKDGISKATFYKRKKARKILLKK